MGKRKDRARTAAASDARRKKAARVEAGMTEPAVRTASLQISPCDALRTSSPPYVDHVRATAAQVIAEDEHGAADEPATRARMAQCEAAQVSRMMEPCVSRHVAHTVVAILIVGWCASSGGCCARYNFSIFRVVYNALGHPPSPEPSQDVAIMRTDAVAAFEARRQRRRQQR